MQNSAFVDPYWCKMLHTYYSTSYSAELWQRPPQGPKPTGPSFFKAFFLRGGGLIAFTTHIYLFEIQVPTLPWGHCVHLMRAWGSQSPWSRGGALLFKISLLTIYLKICDPKIIFHSHCIPPLRAGVSKKAPIIGANLFKMSHIHVYNFFGIWIF